MNFIQLYFEIPGKKWPCTCIKIVSKYKLAIFKMYLLLTKFEIFIVSNIYEPCISPFGFIAKVWYVQAINPSGKTNFWI